MLTPEQVQRLLECACAETKPLYAIAAFAGLRWIEIERLVWENVKDDEIIVTAGTAKTRSRRVVCINPTLKPFLEPYRARIGSLLPRVYKEQRPSSRRLDNLRAKVDTPQAYSHGRKAGYDILSYHICTLLRMTRIRPQPQAGNSPQMVHKHYKALVTKAEATRFWAIVPQ